MDMLLQKSVGWKAYADDRGGGHAASSESSKWPVISVRPGRPEVVNDRSHVTDCCVAGGLGRSLAAVGLRGPPAALPPLQGRCDRCPAWPGGAFITALTGRFWRASENMATMKKLAPVTRPDFERVTKGTARSSRHLKDARTALASHSHRRLCE